jgi:rhodanese-related sulfurtransferase
MLSGDSAGAASAYASAIDVLHGTREDLRSARLHRKAAQAHVMQHDTDQAQAHLRAAEALLGRTPDVAETGRVLGARANWLWRSAGSVRRRRQRRTASPRPSVTARRTTICASGRRAALAASLLDRADVPVTAVTSGGVPDWAANHM